MPDSLYETDALAWSEHQAGLLRSLARGERLNETIDWENVIEEVESVGLSELRACRSMLRQAMIHLLKLYLWPENTAAGHWSAEILGFLADARDSFSPSMRQRLDLPGIYGDAAYQMEAERSGKHDPQLPETCPFLLDDLLAPRPDVMALVVRMRATPEAGNA